MNTIYKVIGTVETLIPGNAYYAQRVDVNSVELYTTMEYMTITDSILYVNGIPVNMSSMSIVESANSDVSLANFLNNLIVGRDTVAMSSSDSNVLVTDVLLWNDWMNGEYRRLTSRIKFNDMSASEINTDILASFNRAVAHLDDVLKQGGL